MMKNIIGDNSDTILFYEYNYLECIINQLQDKNDSAYLNYTNCKQYLKNNPDKYLDLNADIAYYLYLCYSKFLSTSRNDTLSEEEIKLAKKLDKYKYYNTLVYMYMYNYESDKESIQRITKGESSFIYLEKAVALARKIDNKFFLKLAYGRKATYFTSQKIGNMLFKKDVAMQKEINVDLESSKYSFMAYRYTMNEEYMLSHDTNNKLLLKLYNNLMKNEDKYSTDNSNSEIEFVLSLYNMAINALCAKDYESSSFYLLIVIKGMKLLNIFDVQHMLDLTKLYGMIAYCYYKMSMFYKCSTVLNEIKHILSFAFEDEENILNNKSSKARCDTLFFYYLTSGLVLLKDNDLENAKINIEKANKFLLHEERPMAYNISNACKC